MSICLLLVGCASETKPALRAAGALQTFSAQADKFKQHRRDVAKTRQQLLGEEEAQTALLSANTAERQAVWSMIGDKGKARVDAYAKLLAATKAAGDAWAAFEQLQQQQAAALAAADTKVALDGKKLGDVIQALTTLGTPQQVVERVKFYISFALSTRQEIEKLHAAKAASGAQSSSSERTDLRAATSDEAKRGTAAPPPATH
jgi:hypothetical protein